MTTAVVETTAVAPKNMSAWIKSGVAVTATSASDVARQAGLDWSVSLHEVTTTYQVPGQELPTHIPVKNKQAVVKTNALGEVIPLGIVGTKYKPFQNAEVSIDPPSPAKNHLTEEYKRLPLKVNKTFLSEQHLIKFSSNASIYGSNLSFKDPGKNPKLLPTSIAARVLYMQFICFFFRKSKAD